MFRTYGKALAALALAVATAVQAALSDGHISQQEGVQIAVATVTAIGVWLIPIAPRWPWAKTAVAVLLAVLDALATLIVGGITNSDIPGLILAALTVLTVAGAPARSVGMPLVPAPTDGGQA